MKKNNRIGFKFLPLLFILIIILNLVFLYFVKYRNQNLSLNDFNLWNFGNSANLLFAVIIILGIIIAYFKKAMSFDSKLFISFFIINQILLILSYISTVVALPFKDFYYLGQNGNRLFIAVLFTLYNFSYFNIFFLIWLNILKIKDIIVLRALFNSVLLMLIILIFAFIFITKKESGFKDKIITKDPKNIGVVLGAAVWSHNKPSPSLSARVDKAVLLYEGKTIFKIYLTGSNAPGELAESEVALNYIHSLGKDIPDVFIEKETTSTNEQVAFIKKKLLSHKTNIVIVISDGYHLVRVLEISRFHNIKIQVVPSDLIPGFEKAVYNDLREALALTVFWFFAI